MTSTKAETQNSRTFLEVVFTRPTEPSSSWKRKPSGYAPASTAAQQSSVSARPLPKSSPGISLQRYNSKTGKIRSIAKIVYNAAVPISVHPIFRLEARQKRKLAETTPANSSEASSPINSKRSLIRLRIGREIQPRHARERPVGEYGTTVTNPNHAAEKTVSFLLRHIDSHQEIPVRKLRTRNGCGVSLQ